MMFALQQPGGPLASGMHNGVLLPNIGIASPKKRRLDDTIMDEDTKENKGILVCPNYQCTLNLFILLHVYLKL